MIVRLFHTNLLPPSARRPRLLKKACLKTLKLENASCSGEINIVFLDKARMLELNKRYLNCNHDTDVIAFAYPHEKSPAAPALPFGDVFISAPQARTQAKQMGHSVLKEILILIIHGTLHLLGYEDLTPKKKTAMFLKQELILATVDSHRLLK